MSVTLSARSQSFSSSVSTVRRRDARAVHEDVYPRILRRDRVGDGLAVGLFRNVAAHELGMSARVVDFLLNLARQLFVDVRDDNRDARVSEKARDARADARSRAGDYSRLSVHAAEFV